MVKEEDDRGKDENPFLVMLLESFWTFRPVRPRQIGLSVSALVRIIVAVGVRVTRKIAMRVNRKTGGTACSVNEIRSYTAITSVSTVR